jgi:hypothetical protein
MQPERPAPRVVKVTDTAKLLALEDTAAALGLVQRLPAQWLAESVVSGGRHYLWPGLWHRLSHRADISPHLRCELLLELRDQQKALSLLDIMPDDFAALPSVTSREELREVRQLMDSAVPVSELSENPRKN